MSTTIPSQDGNPSILVVDDLRANLDLLAAMLREHGYEPRPVLSGRLALQAARRQAPDLILLDVSMPEMCGYEVCEHLKADPALRDIPVLFITALDDPDAKVRGFAAGGVDYVTKPFQFEELEARIRAHLGIRELQRELQRHNERLEAIVADRTRELERACSRLREMDRIKGDFLRMISHEMRTPCNGILGVGDLLLDGPWSSAAAETYRPVYEESRDRLLALLDDAALIVDLDGFRDHGMATTEVGELLSAVSASLRDVRLEVDAPEAAAVDRVFGVRSLLERALTTLTRLAARLSSEPGRVRLRVVRDGGEVRFAFAADALRLPDADAGRFFEISSTVRSATPAEPLGLAPVVAHRIVELFGGSVSLTGRDGEHRVLETVLQAEETPAFLGSGT